MEDILALVLIFGGGSVFLFAISPIGRAIADRIRGGARESGADAEAVRRLHETQQAMLDDLEAVRQELAEVHERLDFTERLLAQQRGVGRLAPGEAGAAAKPREVAG